MIQSLAKFYKVKTYSDNESKNDATEFMLIQGSTVNLYMKELVLKWGIDWNKVCRAAMEPCIAATLPQVARSKREGEKSSNSNKDGKKRYSRNKLQGTRLNEQG